MLASVPTFALEGVDGREVSVEVDVRRGLPAFTLVGLPDAAVREARERVRAAVLNAGLNFPQQRLTANLAPASMRKAGPGFDLALAVALLAASGQVPRESLAGTAVSGELSLSGRLRTVRGAIAIAIGARRAGYRRLIVAAENAREARLAGDLEVVGVPDLRALVELLHGRWQPLRFGPEPEPRRRAAVPDLAHVRGQDDARRALEIAAAGGHNLLMIGPPGAGKTMMARRLPGILPPPTTPEALEITRIRSVAGLPADELARERPFRAPHHTTTAQGLVGGSTPPRPGEVTLAHRGVLFLDELAEFPRPALEALRQPLEDGLIEIVRAQRPVTFPARTMLVAASNPCPCGRPPARCTCDELAKARYARRLSGPLLDRIDILCFVGSPPPAAIVGRGEPGEPSAPVAARVAAARDRQLRRLEGTRAWSNADMDAALTRRHAGLGPEASVPLIAAANGGLVSARGADRVLRVARTIADLEGKRRIAPAHVEEALGYRTDATTAVAA